MLLILCSGGCHRESEGNLEIGTVQVNPMLKTVKVPVAPEQGTVSVVFDVTNRGKQTVHLGEIHSDCSCVEAAFSSTRLRPGVSTELNVTTKFSGTSALEGHDIVFEATAGAISDVIRVGVRIERESDWRVISVPAVQLMQNVSNDFEIFLEYNGRPPTDVSVHSSKGVVAKVKNVKQVREGLQQLILTLIAEREFFNEIVEFEIVAPDKQPKLMNKRITLNTTPPIGFENSVVEFQEPKASLKVKAAIDGRLFDCFAIPEGIVEVKVSEVENQVEVRRVKPSQQNVVTVYARYRSDDQCYLFNCTLLLGSE